MPCDHCGTRIERDEPFSFRGWNFCCECMSALASWLLEGWINDGGSDIFGYVMSSRGDERTTTT